MSKRVVESDIPELTALRILAALCVVVSHLHGLGIVSASRFHEIVDGGRPAVSFFFVLSGFIMIHRYPRLHWTDRAVTKRYAQSRIARLYPTLLLSLLLALPTVIYLASAHANARLLSFYALKDHYLFWLVASALAQLSGLTGWIPAAAINQPWNGPAWSLSCEFFFYALFPLLRAALQRHSTRTLLLALMTGWTLQGLWIVAIQTIASPNRAGFLVSQFPVTHLFEFVLGICAGILVGRLNRRQSTMLITLAALLSLLIFNALHLSHSAMPAYYGLSPLFAAAIMATVRASGTLWLAPLRHQLFQALGHASYALYMIHIPILVGASVLGIAADLGWLWLPLLMLTSCCIHYCYAEPIRRWLLNRPEVNVKKVALNQRSPPL
jgi:peptidoglycan/LPS O-acetylase OafA/YrhL